MYKQVWVIALILWIGGCATVNVEQEYAALSPNDALEPRYYDVDIPMRDGVNIRATVYQPQLKPGQSAPLVITTHGWAGFRTSGPLSFWGLFMISGEATLNAWHNNYWVISYDQRGFGDSGGDVEMMLPEYEPQDVSDIVTWANQHIPRLKRQTPEDPVIGMVGESWGGGSQLMASIADPRIDAIVPITTWNNLAKSLAPNNTVKTYWGVVFELSGLFSSGFDTGKLFESPYVDMMTGRMTPEGQAALERSSPSTYCAQQQYPHADMLLIQGFRDSMFSINEGLANRQCALEGGRDVRLVAIQKGHRLPWPTQSIDGMMMYSTDKTIDCGEVKYDTQAMILQWLDLKLKDKPEEHPIPELCLTLPEEQKGYAPNELIVGGEQFSIPEVDVDLIHTGWFEIILDPLSRLVSYVLPSGEVENASKQSTSGGSFRPLFVPIWVARSETTMIGIPQIDLAITGGSEDNQDVVFVAIGVRRKNSLGIDIVSEQIYPLVGNGSQKMDLPGISILLEEDDTVGLIFQGYSGQYFFNPEGWFEGIEITGEIKLPLVNPKLADRSLVVDSD